MNYEYPISFFKVKKP